MLNVLIYCMSGSSDDEVSIQELKYEEKKIEKNDRMVLYLVIAILLAIFIVAAMVIVYKIRRK